MLEFIGTCIVIWLVFRLLDLIFRRNAKIKTGDFFKEIDGQLYIVREVEADQPAPQPQGKPDLHIVK